MHASKLTLQSRSRYFRAAAATISPGYLVLAAAATATTVAFVIYKNPTGPRLLAAPRNASDSDSTESDNDEQELISVRRRKCNKLVKRFKVSSEFFNLIINM